MNASFLKLWDDFLVGADVRFRAFQDEVRELVRSTSVPGPAGPPGEPGAEGSPGPAGTQGAQGAQGPAGERGEKGDPGLQGERGADGPEGRRGPPGEPGATGERGERGEKGADGRDGRDGPQGLPGRDGKDGAPGRDGVSLEQFQAALADATEKAAAAVLASIEFDGRTWKVGDHVIRTPAPEYRGVFSESESYEPGDFVTWAGSLWACRAATAAKPGDGSPSWSLAAKKGRDGRDGKDGAPAPLPVVTIGGPR